MAGNHVGVAIPRRAGTARRAPTQDADISCDGFLPVQESFMSVNSVITKNESQAIRIWARSAYRPDTHSRLSEERHIVVGDA